ncbi:hypothetical protein TNCV_3290801 [Trichonephila clavipes]|nr:hypothetical protein TNCV_3290801 [Trichonephila clavipes]
MCFYGKRSGDHISQSRRQSSEYPTTRLSIFRHIFADPQTQFEAGFIPENSSIPPREFRVQMLPAPL